MASFSSVIGQQDYTGAVKLLDAAIDETKQEYAAALQRLAQLYFNRGVCNQKLQLNRKALKDFDAALAVEPSHVKALLHKGQVLLSLGKNADARATWESATALADPCADLDTILHINEALAGLGGSGGSSSSSAEAVLDAAAATPGLTPVSTAADTHISPAPQPQKTPEAGIAAPHANGVIAPGHTALAAHSAQQEAAGASTSPAKADSQGAKAAPKAFKGFLGKGGTTSSKPAAAKDSSSSRTTSSAGKVSSAATDSSADASSVVDIDCTAQQKQKQNQQQQSFLQQVSHQQQHSVMLGIAINQINSGQVDAAEELLNKVLASNPRDLSALVARGTARALRRDAANLKKAEEDFTAAIQIEPRYPDTYKRRSQARTALGDTQGALEDLDKAAQLLEGVDRDGLGALLQQQSGEDPRQTAADCYSERGMLLQRLKDYRLATRELAKAVEKDPKNPQAWNLLGLARVSMGDIRDGVKAYRRALELSPNMQEAWLNLGQACKEEARVAEAEEALTKALKYPDGMPCLAAYRLLATMRQGAGRQATAVKLLDKALSFKKDSVELLYLRAICHHAMGYVRKAVADYEATMDVVLPQRDDLSPALEENKAFQFLSFYQRDLALWLYHHLDQAVDRTCLDTDLAPAFKEGWCKKCAPERNMLIVYKPQEPLPPEDSSNSSSKRGSSTATSPRTSSTGPSSSGNSPNGPSTSSSRAGSAAAARVESPTPSLGAATAAPAPEQVAALTAAADTLGNLLQNHHQGFLPNVRQQRAAGLAALQLAQTVRLLLKQRAAGGELWIESSGSSGERGCNGRHIFGWRDAMDIVVKWRQLSEPADQVVWVDLLTKEEFENGFGSHTPMYSGQTKCVRYYMNFERAMALAKECLLELGHAYDAQNREVPLGGEDKQDAVKESRTALELYRVIGQDSWVVVPLHSIFKHSQQRAGGNGANSSNKNSSSSSNGKAKGGGKSGGKQTSSSSSSSSRPVGRRQGVQPVVVPEGCLEGTRLTLVNVPNQPNAVEFSIRTPVTPPRWKEFDAELEAGWERIIAALLSGDKPAIATAIMCYTYYWYNFMPLARGTAAVGYTTMLGLFWAAGMPITTPIPQDYQVDWEAILAKHPQQFINRLSEWFVPKTALPCAPVPHSNSSNSSSDKAAAAPAAAPATNGSSAAGPELLPPVESLPEVAEVLATFRQRLNALNGPDAPPV